MRPSFRRLPHFCPDALKYSTSRLSPLSRPSSITKSLLRPLPPQIKRWQSSAATTTELDKALDEQDSIDRSGAKIGPLTACPGCGAPAQTIEPGEPGYYTLKRKTVSSFINQYSIENIESSSTATTALNDADPGLLKSLGLSSLVQDGNSGQELPLCNRCHQLVHHHVGVPIHHPSMDSLADTIAESPYKYNHIYHVVDAADFPMSLVKNIHELLDTSGLRSKNRRAKHTKFRHGKVTELSFIITRSDLLAPKKEQVDSMMPVLLDILRDALGSAAREVRLGNVRCVSAKRGWWTKELKADVYKRGGGGWMVGKVNVGKSNLFEVIFPKGKAEDINFDVVRRDARKGFAHLLPDEADKSASTLSDEYNLLPPARIETPYPVMPTISSLPGTTASPIRIPFGNGKGELIDLPGLARSKLDEAIAPEHQDNLVMKARCVPEQYVIKPGQSLLLGGLVRITPVEQQDLIILAYPFAPLKPHLTSTEKAIEIQTGTKASGFDPAVITQEAKEDIKSAGIFELQHDVTKYRAGPLTTSAGAGLKVLDLPFRVLSADILVESVGWIELVAQVRRGRRGGSRDTAEAHAVVLEEHFPKVEVFTPGGKFIAVRRPLNAWLLGGQQKRSSHAKGRPRKSMASERRNRSPA